MTSASTPRPAAAVQEQWVQRTQDSSTEEEGRDMSLLDDRRWSASLAASDGEGFGGDIIPWGEQKLKVQIMDSEKGRPWKRRGEKTIMKKPWNHLVVSEGQSCPNSRCAAHQTGDRTCISSSSRIVGCPESSFLASNACTLELAANHRQGESSAAERGNALSNFNFQERALWP